MNISNSFKTIFIILLAGYLFLATALVYFSTADMPISHAVISMGAGLILLWVVICGSLMFLLRGKIKFLIQQIPVNWQIKFILFCIFMAMLEEAITTSMTNLAPIFGVEIGRAYITASANYFDVILHHSVIVFVPYYIVWAWILKRFDFSPFWVFLLYGLNGTFGESLTFGWQHLSEFALWIFVYGLMVYLPAYTIPDERGARPPKIWHGILSFILATVVGIAWAIMINLIFPNHPGIHFPPIQI